MVAQRQRSAYTYLIMVEVINLGQAKIYHYLICPRRFQLRYLERIPWPSGSQDAKWERARDLGQRFHTVLHRHFLGLPQGDEVHSEPELGRWWTLFKEFEPQIPVGRMIPELTLTVPAGGATLTGRFDLAVVNSDAVHIIDWKTVRAKSKEELTRDLQSRIYLALAAESGDVFGRLIRPEEVTLTYWFATDPAVDVTISYGRREHHENWTYLTSIAAEIESRLVSDGSWPLTDELAECEGCAYQILCSRGPGTMIQVEPDDMNELDEMEEPSSIEPGIP